MDHDSYEMLFEDLLEIENQENAQLPANNYNVDH